MMEHDERRRNDCVVSFPGELPWPEVLEKVGVDSVIWAVFCMMLFRHIVWPSKRAPPGAPHGIETGG